MGISKLAIIRFLEPAADSQKGLEARTTRVAGTLIPPFEPNVKQLLAKSPAIKIPETFREGFQAIEHYQWRGVNGKNFHPRLGQMRNNLLLSAKVFCLRRPSREYIASV